MQPIASMKNVSGLGAMCDLVEGNVHNLSSLGVPSDTHGKLLFHFLIEKIPHSLLSVISREFDDEVWDLQNMLKYFKKELFAKERCASLVHENRIIVTSPMKKAFLSGQQKLCCVYYQREHFPAKCDKVTNVNAPKEILKNSLCCYFCLKTGHVSKKCTKNYICRIGSKKHHISICEEKNKQLPDQSPNTAVNLNHEKVVKMFYCSQRFCRLKILKMHIIAQTAQFFLTLVVRDHL